MRPRMAIATTPLYDVSELVCKTTVLVRTQYLSVRITVRVAVRTSL